MEAVANLKPTSEGLFAPDGRLRAGPLRQMCLAAGAEDAALVSVDDPALAGEREAILSAFPRARTLVSYCVTMRRENIRSPARSLANLEFHAADDGVTEAGRRLVAALEAEGVRALHTAFGFPMEMDRWPGRVWVVSHKKVAEAAGLGRMGVHRNAIHPKFGNFILLGTVLVAAEADAWGRPLDFNPCVSCKLCVAACPVGAISPEGRFDFSACYTHNYREFMSGFTSWAETVAESKDARDYRRRVPDDESVSLWQSLSFQSNYKAAYCMAVCPAGEDVMGPYLADKKAHLAEVVRPLQRKEEKLFVTPGSDAEAHAARRFPHKRLRRVSNALRPASVAGFLRTLPIAFQPGKAEGLEATFHFTFTGEERAEATVDISGGEIRVAPGHVGVPNLTVRADSKAWIAFLRKDRSLWRLLLAGRLRVGGRPALLAAFARCFPS